MPYRPSGASTPDDSNISVSDSILYLQRYLNDSSTAGDGSTLLGGGGGGGIGRRGLGRMDETGLDVGVAHSSSARRSASSPSPLDAFSSGRGSVGGGGFYRDGLHRSTSGSGSWGRPPLGDSARPYRSASSNAVRDDTVGYTTSSGGPRSTIPRIKPVSLTNRFSNGSFHDDSYNLLPHGNCNTRGGRGGWAAGQELPPQQQQQQHPSWEAGRYRGSPLHGRLGGESTPTAASGWRPRSTSLAAQQQQQLESSAVNTSRSSRRGKSPRRPMDPSAYEPVPDSTTLTVPAAAAGQTPQRSAPSLPAVPLQEQRSRGGIMTSIPTATPTAAVVDASSQQQHQQQPPPFTTPTAALSFPMPGRHVDNLRLLSLYLKHYYARETEEDGRGLETLLPEDALGLAQCFYVDLYRLVREERRQGNLSVGMFAAGDPNVGPMGSQPQQQQQWQMPVGARRPSQRKQQQQQASPVSSPREGRESSVAATATYPDNPSSPSDHDGDGDSYPEDVYVDVHRPTTPERPHRTNSSNSRTSRSRPTSNSGSRQSRRVPPRRDEGRDSGDDDHTDSHGRRRKSTQHKRHRRSSVNASGDDVQEEDEEDVQQQQQQPTQYIVVTPTRPSATRSGHTSANQSARSAHSHAAAGTSINGGGSSIILNSAGGITITPPSGNNSNTSDGRRQQQPYISVQVMDPSVASSGGSAHHRTAVYRDQDDEYSNGIGGGGGGGPGYNVSVLSANDAAQDSGGALPLGVQQRVLAGLPASPYGRHRFSGVDFANSSGGEYSYDSNGGSRGATLPRSGRNSFRGDISGDEGTRAFLQGSPQRSPSLLSQQQQPLRSPRRQQQQQQQPQERQLRQGGTRASWASQSPRQQQQQQQRSPERSRPPIAPTNSSSGGGSGALIPYPQQQQQQHSGILKRPLSALMPLLRIGTAAVKFVSHRRDPHLRFFLVQDCLASFNGREVLMPHLTWAAVPSDSSVEEMKVKAAMATASGAGGGGVLPARSDLRTALNLIELRAVHVGATGTTAAAQLFKRHRSGTVAIDSHGRPIPDGMCAVLVFKSRSVGIGFLSESDRQVWVGAMMGVVERNRSLGV